MSHRSQSSKHLSLAPQRAPIPEGNGRPRSALSEAGRHPVERNCGSKGAGEQPLGGRERGEVFTRLHRPLQIGKLGAVWGAGAAAASLGAAVGWSRCWATAAEGCGVASCRQWQTPSPTGSRSSAGARAACWVPSTRRRASPLAASRGSCPTKMLEFAGLHWR